MTFKQVFAIVSTHVAWQVYTIFAMLKGNSVLLASFGLLIGAFTYMIYHDQFKKETPNAETKA